MNLQIQSQLLLIERSNMDVDEFKVRQIHAYIICDFVDVCMDCIFNQSTGLFKL